MNYTSYICTIRNNLCYTLTAQRKNKERIQRLDERIENMLAVPEAERQYRAGRTILELSRGRRFLEELNCNYNKESSRLVAALLEKTKAEI